MRVSLGLPEPRFLNLSRMHLVQGIKRTHSQMAAIGSLSAMLTPSGQTEARRGTHFCLLVPTDRAMFVRYGSCPPSLMGLGTQDGPTLRRSLGGSQFLGVRNDPAFPCLSHSLWPVAIPKGDPTVTPRSRPRG